MDITHFFQSIPDKLNKIFVPDPVLENIFVMKTGIVLISISLLISSLALFILALPRHGSKRSHNLIKPFSSPKTSSKMTNPKDQP